MLVTEKNYNLPVSITGAGVAGNTNTKPTEAENKAENGVVTPLDKFVYSEKTETIGIYSPDSVHSTYAGDTLYDKLNGQTVMVSYTGGSQDNEVIIDLSKKEFRALSDMCGKAGIEPSTVLAIIAHESGFNADAENSSSGACGLMQVLEEYYEPFLTMYDDIYTIAKTAAGISDRIKDDPFNSIGNMAAGISALKNWKSLYGEADMIKAYAQGYKGSGWGTTAQNADKEIRAIKSQIDKMLNS